MKSELHTEEGGTDVDFSCAGVMQRWPLWLLILIAAFLFIACAAIAAGYFTTH